MKPEIPINIDDFAKISPLVRGYELDPAKVYLIVCDGKDFNSGLAHSLMKDIMQMHPNLNVAVVASLKPKSIEVREKADEEKTGPAAPLPGAGGQDPR